MSYVVYIKDNIGNELHTIDEDLPKHFHLQQLQINDGFLVKGAYRIPINHILFIHEV